MYNYVYIANLIMGSVLAGWITREIKNNMMLSDLILVPVMILYGLVFYKLFIKPIREYNGTAIAWLKDEGVN